MSIQIIQSQFGNSNTSQSYRIEEEKYLNAMKACYNYADSDDEKENQQQEAQISNKSFENISNRSMPNENTYENEKTNND